MAIQLDSGQLIRRLRATMDEMFPGSIRYTPVVQHFGFGIAANGGLTVVHADPANPWFLYMTAGIAQNAGDISAALRWINEKNSALRLCGRYYASLPAAGPTRCNVVFQCNAWSEMLSEDGYVDSIMTMLQFTTEAAERAPTEFLSAVGGSHFEDSPESVSLLVAASFG